MEQPGTRRAQLEEMAQSLKKHNQRYLDYLKQSGDPADVRSKTLACILDSAAEGLVVFDENLKIVMANLAAAQLARWQLDDVSRAELRQNYEFYYDEGKTRVPYDQEPIQIAIREKRWHEMEGFVMSERLPRPGLWMRVHAAPMFDDDGKPVGGVTVFGDITENKKLQRQRDSLAALIAHDIKNHLASEYGFFELLMDSLSDRLSPDLLKMIEELQSSSSKFLSIADSLIEMSRARFLADSSFAQDIFVEDLVRQAVELSALAASTLNVRVEIHCPQNCSMIRGLPGVIRHVLHNVIQNAIEASPPGSVVNICVSSDESIVTMEVADSGIGMSAEEVATLFSPLRVAGHIPKTTASSGFGLYLSHMLIEGQGGTLNCTSEPGHGTTMIITMPAIS